MPQLRPAIASDVPAVLKLIAEVYAEYDCVLNVEDDEPHLRDPCQYFRKSGGEFWVVEEESVVKATVALFLHEDAGELKTLYVHRSLRRRGWGRRLVELAMSRALQSGRRKMILWSDTRFLEAHSLYRSLGFRQREVRELNDSNNSVEYGFELQL